VIHPVFELVKVAALAAVVALITAHFLGTLNTALVAVVAFWLLLARIT
jgi:hypothetical protein